MWDLVINCRFPYKKLNCQLITYNLVTYFCSKNVWVYTTMILIKPVELLIASIPKPKVSVFFGMIWHSGLYGSAEGKLNSTQNLELFFPYTCRHSLFFVSLFNPCSTLSVPAIKIKVARQGLCPRHLSLIYKGTDCHQPI